MYIIPYDYDGFSLYTGSYFCDGSFVPPSGHYTFTYTPTMAGSTWTTAFAFNANATSTHTFILDNVSMCAINTVASYSPDIISETDYYAFGQTTPGRSWYGTVEGYRYGMNGTEKNNELAPGYYDTYYRLYDSRIARWLSPDVITIPSESPFAGMANNPILYSDPLGDKVKYGKASDFLKVAYMWISDKQFRKDFRKNVLDRYGRGGKNKEDVTISVDAKSHETLKEAVHNGSTIQGKAVKDKKDHLKYNGNLDADVFEIQEGYEAEVDVKSGGSGFTAEEKFQFSFDGNKADYSWKYRIKEPKDFISEGIWPSQSFDKNYDLKVVIQQKRSMQIMGNAVYDRNGNKVIEGTYRDDGDKAPEWDHISVIYHISAMGQKRIYRVERTLFGGWDYANKVPSTMSFNRSKTFVKKMSWSSIPGSRNVYKTGKKDE
jgi:RHS repeat-associated protein